MTPAAPATVPRALLCALVLCGGCHRQAASVALKHLPESAAPPEAQLAARVNGRAISVAEVAAQARAAGTSPEQALAELVRSELVAQAADDRGLYTDGQVQEAGKREMVRRFLQDTFEKEVTPENTITEQMVKKAYNRNLGRMVHPLLKDVQHIVFQTQNDDEQVRALAEQLRTRALQQKTVQEFARLRDEFVSAANRYGAPARTEHLVTARTGTTVEPFARAAFDLKRPGEVSPVVRTSYGYHVIWLVQDVPPENVSLAQATPKIRADLFPAQRARAFTRFEDDLAKQHQITLFPERLKNVAERPPTLGY